MTPTPAPQSPSKLKAALMKAAAKKRRANLPDRLQTEGQTLSATGVAAIEFTSERPSLSESQKDRVAAIIAGLDQMSPLERNLIKSLVTRESFWTAASLGIARSGPGW